MTWWRPCQPRDGQSPRAQKVSLEDTLAAGASPQPGDREATEEVAAGCGAGLGSDLSTLPAQAQARGTGPRGPPDWLTGRKALEDPTDPRAWLEGFPCMLLRRGQAR